MKILHFSDTHLGAIRYNKKESYYEFFSAFREAINFIYDLKPDVVIHSGDLFDSKRPDSLTMSLAFSEILKVSKEFPFLIIPGNHEISLNTGLSPISILSVVSENVKIVEQRDILNEEDNFIEKVKFSYNGANFYLLPYIANREILRKMLNKIVSVLNTSDMNFLVLHQIVDEETSRRKHIEVDVPIEELFSFDFVFLGHFHIPKIKHKFAYAGSTQALKYDEYEYDENGFIKENSKKRVVLYEFLDKNGLKFYNKFILKSQREFIKLEFNEPSISEIEGTLKQYEDPKKILILKLNNIEPIELSEIKKLLNNFNFYDTKVDAIFKLSERKPFEIEDETDYKKQILGDYYEDIVRILSDVEEKENDKVQKQEIISRLKKLRGLE